MKRFEQEMNWMDEEERILDPFWRNGVDVRSQLPGDPAGWYIDDDSPEGEEANHRLTKIQVERSKKSRW